MKVEHLPAKVLGVALAALVLGITASTVLRQPVVPCVAIALAFFTLVVTLAHLF